MQADADISALHYGSWSGRLSPEWVSTIVPDETAINLKSGSVLNARARMSYDKAENRLVIDGQGSVFGSGSRDPRPQGTATSPRSSLGAVLWEGYGENQQGNWRFSLGKRAFDFSSALLTSPSNPALSGLSLVSPLLPQEGLWNGWVQWLPSEKYALQVGTAVSQTSATSLLAPFLRFSANFNAVDTWTVAANRFLGWGANWQARESLLIYGEGNLNQTRFSLPGESELHSDWLFGSQWSPGLWGMKLTLEYFRNGYGLAGSASSQRRKALGQLRGDTRARVYSFPAPANFASPTAGIGSFFSRDLLFADLRSESLGSTPFLTAMGSLNDASLLSILGYRWTLSSSSDDGWGLTLEWRRFSGLEGSEFGEAAHQVGANQFWITFALR